MYMWSSSQQPPDSGDDSFDVLPSFRQVRGNLFGVIAVGFPIPGNSRYIIGQPLISNGLERSGQSIEVNIGSSQSLIKHMVAEKLKPLSCPRRLPADLRQKERKRHLVIVDKHLVAFPKHVRIPSSAIRILNDYVKGKNLNRERLHQ